MLAMAPPKGYYESRAVRRRVDKVAFWLLLLLLLFCFVLFLFFLFIQFILISDSEKQRK